MNIYDKIDARIKELGIKKAHVSTSLGMSRAWLNSAQAYQTYLPPATLDKIAAILQTTKEALLDGVEGYQILDVEKSAPTMKAAAMERIHNVGKASKG